jgi:hypothetical protein
MDKLQEIENKYLNNEWAWNSYIQLMDKDDLSWLIQSVKTLRQIRISDGNLLIEQATEINRLRDAIKGAAVITGRACIQIAELKQENQHLKKQSWYKVYEENLELAKALQKTKKGIVIREWTDF